MIQWSKFYTRLTLCLRGLLTKNPIGRTIIDVPLTTMTDYIKNSAFCKLGVTQKSRNIKGKNDQLDRDKIKLLSFERRATKKIDNPQTGRDVWKIQRIDKNTKDW